MFVFQASISYCIMVLFIIQLGFPAKSYCSRPWRTITIRVVSAVVLDHAHSLVKHIGISKHVEVQSIGFDKTPREYI